MKCLACMHVRLRSHAHGYKKGLLAVGPGPQRCAIGQRPALVYLGNTHGVVGQGAVIGARETWRVHACIDAHGRGMKRSAADPQGGLDELGHTASMHFARGRAMCAIT